MRGIGKFGKLMPKCGSLQKRNIRVVSFGFVTSSEWNPMLSADGSQVSGNGIDES
jgi:hypothetical protein